MKRAARIVRLACILLTLSVVFTTTSCTIEFSDNKETVPDTSESSEQTSVQTSVEDEPTASSGDKISTIVESDPSASTGISDAVINNDGTNITVSHGGSQSSGNTSVTDIPVVTPAKPTIPRSGDTGSEGSSNGTEPSTSEATTSETKIPDTTKATTTPQPTATATSKPTSASTSTPTPTKSPAPTQTTGTITQNNCYAFSGDGSNTKKLECALGSIVIEPGNSDVTISVNGNNSSLPVSYSDKYGIILNDAYLVNSNGTNYIYLISTVGGELYNTNVYKINGNSVSYVGLAERVSFTGIASSLSFYGDEWGGMGIMYAYREYKTGSDGMPVPKSVYYFDSKTYKLAFDEDMEGYIISGGNVTTETYKINKYNDFVTPVETDGNTYLDVMTSSGIVVRLDFTSFFSWYYEHYTVDIFYEGIMEKVMDWKEP